ncbi:MAG TPA: PQQ-dependent sugar dehydrogenase [Roseimicrobium sp.]|nr:PQQ-dependent sugar dehydrogenase [Roseimicrobium sp.]
MHSILSVQSIAVFALAVALLGGQVSAADTASLKLVADGLVSPMALASLPDGSDNRLVMDQVGVIHLLNTSGQLEPELFLDLRPKLTKIRDGFDERGALGLAIHPKFKSNGKFYVFYSAPLRSTVPTNWDHCSQISEFRVDASNPKRADIKTERIVLQIDKPAFNHNGGRIAFGADGYLYIGVGDGGGGDGCDKGMGHAPEGNGQNKATLLGKILRIDVDGRSAGLEYGIPKGNPFAKGGGRAEIFAYGIRNPWGLSVDRGGKHEVFAADVGQSMFEEINIIRNGGNYGWRLREGLIGFNPENQIKPPEAIPAKGDDGSPLIDPIIAYKNLKGHPGGTDLKGTSVTGGYVYRGKAMPGLVGRYLFGDWSRNWGVGDGVIYIGTPSKDGKGPWEMSALTLDNLKNDRLGGYITAFGEDDKGEVYVLVNGRNGLTGKTGKVYQIVPSGQGNLENSPR